MWSRAILPAFYEKGDVNFGPLITENWWKYHNRSFLTWFIRANIVTSPIQQPFLSTSSLSHCKHWSITVSEKHANHFLCPHFIIFSIPCLIYWKQSLQTVEMPFNTITVRGERHRLSLTFIGQLFCNFHGVFTVRRSICVARYLW